jgi:hypothetical protein
VRRRDALAALVIAVVSGRVFASPALDIAHGLSIAAGPASPFISFNLHRRRLHGLRCSY